MTADYKRKNLSKLAQKPNPSLGRVFVENFRLYIRRTNTGSTLLNEWSADRRGRCLHNRHNKLKRWKAMPPAGFELAIPAIKRPRADALDRTVTGIGNMKYSTVDLIETPRHPTWPSMFPSIRSTRIQITTEQVTEIFILTSTSMRLFNCYDFNARIDR